MVGVYDVCIVGAGMVGSAAARHASLPRKDGRNPRICLVGPKEPKERDLLSPRDIFGCHYDEGRIIRELDPDVTWSTLASRSIQRYRAVEKASGVPFYTETGFLVAGTHGNAQFERFRRVEKDNDITSAEELTINDVNVRFPYLNFGSEDTGVFQAENGGHINPRKFVLAQQTVAQLQGCDIIKEVVIRVSEDKQRSGPVMEVETEGGRVVLARKVLLATNGFTNLAGLLSVTPDIRLIPECVSFVEISTERAVQLRDMPSIIYCGEGGPDWVKPSERIADGQNYSFYLLPPIKYPDGRYYLKLGSIYLTQVPLETRQDVKRWYCLQPPSDLVHEYATLISSVVKDVEPISITGDTCVIAYTDAGRPYIDLVSPNLGVAIGGNGGAAKSADEIGRLGVAMLSEGRWSDDLPTELFKLKLKTTHSKL